MTQSGVSLWPAQLWCPYGTRDGLENAFGFRPMQVNPGTGSPPNAKPTSPVLTPEQKRYRIERFKNCIKRLEAFDPQNMQHRLGVPEVVTLEAGIDKALSATFGYGTPAYLRFNLAARLDAGPLLTSAALQHAGPRTVGYDEREARDARIYFAEGKQRSLVLLRQAISTVEGELAARPRAGLRPSLTASPPHARNATPRAGRGSGVRAAWERLAHWWRGR